MGKCPHLRCFRCLVSLFTTGKLLSLFSAVRNSDRALLATSFAVSIRIVSSHSHQKVPSKDHYLAHKNKGFFKKLFEWSSFGSCIHGRTNYEIGLWRKRSGRNCCSGHLEWSVEGLVWPRVPVPGNYNFSLQNPPRLVGMLIQGSMKWESSDKISQSLCSETLWLLARSLRPVWLC